VAEAASASQPIDSAEVPAGIRERTAARARLSAAWACLNAPDLGPGDPAEIWSATLTPEHQRRAEQDYAQVMAWAQQNCRTLPPGLLDKNGRLSLPDLLVLASTAPNDPRGQLAAVVRERKQTHDPATVDGVRVALEALLRSALAAPAAEELQLIGALVSTQGPPGALGPGSGAHWDVRRMVWALAACDLGDDCGPRSPVLRQLCFQEFLCGYPNLEAAVLDGVWPQGMTQALQAERRELVRRLRENAGVGLFEPLPASPPGRG
ncbi:MAG TPA: hypothetical protein VN259_13875, partial [Xanthomonadales bacterium]|nr:hypothetical protein [Xanthomonadales bacterium]